MLVIITVIRCWRFMQALRFHLKRRNFWALREVGMILTSTDLACPSSYQQDSVHWTHWPIGPVAQLGGNFDSRWVVFVGVDRN
jgi:hypothetical protein